MLWREGFAGLFSEVGLVKSTSMGAELAVAVAVAPVKDRGMRSCCSISTGLSFGVWLSSTEGSIEASPSTPSNSNFPSSCFSFSGTIKRKNFVSMKICGPRTMSAVPNSSTDTPSSKITGFAGRGEGGK